MAIDIPLNSPWTYVGTDGGMNETHIVIWIGNDEIISTSYVNEKKSARSFCGTRARFLRDFKPASTPMWIWPFKRPTQ